MFIALHKGDVRRNVRAAPGPGRVLRGWSYECRGVIPAKLSAGHYAAVYGNELWVFPMPRNHNMRRVYCLDLQRYRHALTTWAMQPPLKRPAFTFLQMHVVLGYPDVLGAPERGAEQGGAVTWRAP